MADSSVITETRFEAPATARSERRRRLGLTFVCLWAFLLSVQLPALTAGQNLSLALSDVVLVVGVLATLSSIRLRDGAWSLWHFLMPVYLAASAMLVGPMTRYSIANKVVGIAVLLASYVFITSHIWAWEDIAKVVRWFYAGMVVLTALSLIRYFLGFDLPFTYCQTCDIRLIAFMPDPNLYGSLVVVALAAFVALDGSRFPLTRSALRWPSLFVLVVGLVLSSSRSAWLGMAAVFLVAFLTGRRRPLRPLVGGLLGVVAAAFVIAPESVLRFTDLAGRTHSIESRFTLIDGGIQAFFENPLVGVGLGASHERFGQIIHNTLLWIAAELGVIGLIIFGGFLLWMATRLTDAYNGATRTHRPLVSFLIMGNLAMLIFSMSVEAFYQRHWWLLFALTAAAVVAGRETPSPAAPVAASPSAALGSQHG